LTKRRGCATLPREAMPLQISTRSRYGLRLMIVLAEHYGRGVTLMKDVSHAENISEKYLGQIIMPLRGAGLVTSQRGSHGGYMLARPPAEITVRDIVVAIEGKISPDPDADNVEASTHPTALAASKVWKRLADNMDAALAAFTLAELVRLSRELQDQEPEVNYVI
jgi:Rrf2 family protein